MNFGDILNEWESGPDPEKKQEKGKDQFEKLLKDYLPDPAAAGRKDDDRTTAETGSDHWKRMKIQDTIDLHGMTVSEGGAALEAFLRQSLKRGLSKVLIIHGKGLHSSGDPVLAKFVRRYLESCPFTGRTGIPGRDEGGNGAVWVILRSGYRSR